MTILTSQIHGSDCRSIKAARKKSRVITAFKCVSLLIIILQGAGCTTAPKAIYQDPSVLKAEYEHKLIDSYLTHSSWALERGGQASRDEIMRIVAELNIRNPHWRWLDIIAARVSVGMTRSEAILAWGKPTTVTEQDFGEQWFYQRHDKKGQYIYFQQGQVRTFKDGQ